MVDTEQELRITDESGAAGPIVLSLAGELDINSATDLRSAVMDRREPAARAGMVIDLSSIAFLDSSAVGALLDAATLVRSGGGGFAVVVGERTQSRSRLDLTGTSRVLNVCYDREEAFDLLGSGDTHMADSPAPDDPGPSGTLTVTLFLNGGSPHAARARTAADELRRRLPQGAAFEHIDVTERPDLAERHRVLATPMLIRSGPPHRRVVGDLSNLDEVLFALDLPIA